jgi:hypothetical protein
MVQQPNEPKPSKPVSDDKLLADAIPIEDMEEGSAPALTESAIHRASIELAGAEGQGGAEIRKFERHAAADHQWVRPTKVTGRGAVHMKTFVAKLRLDAIENLDAQVNKWLDEHPDYEVKFVNTTIGILTGKLREEALFMNVWV